MYVSASYRNEIIVISPKQQKTKLIPKKNLLVHGYIVQNHMNNNMTKNNIFYPKIYY